MLKEHVKVLDRKTRIQYTADGKTTEYVYGFVIFKEQDLEVYLNDKRIADGFSVVGVGETAGGAVRFDAAPPAEAIVTLARRLNIARTSDFQTSGILRAKVLNDELDFLTAALQDIADRVERSVRIATTDLTEPSDVELPKSAERADKWIKFDGQGRLVAVDAPAAGGSGTSGLSQDEKRKLDSVEHGATADQSGREIVAAIDAALGGAQWQSGGQGAASWGSIAGEMSAQADLQAALASKSPASHRHDDHYYTEGEINGLLSGKADADHSHDAAYAPADHAGSGGDAHPVATAKAAGFMAAADKRKLDGVEDGATADMSGGEIVKAIDDALGRSDWQAGAGGGGSGGAAVPSGGVSGSAAFVEAGAFKVYSDTGRDPATGIFRLNAPATAVHDADHLTPGAQPASWRPDVVAGVTRASFDAELTILKPSCAVTDGEFKLKLVLKNSSARSQKVVFDTGPDELSLRGWKVPFNWIPGQTEIEAELLTDDGGKTWYVLGRPAVEHYIPIYFEGELVPECVVIEMEAPQDLIWPFHWDEPGDVECAGPGPSAETVLELQRYDAPWRTIGTISFAPQSMQAMLALHPDYPDGVTIGKGSTYRVLAPASTNGINQVRGHLRCGI
jgi:hypothetical protein